MKVRQEGVFVLLKNLTFPIINAYHAFLQDIGILLLKIAKYVHKHFNSTCIDKPASVQLTFHFYKMVDVYPATLQNIGTNSEKCVAPAYSHIHIA